MKKIISLGFLIVFISSGIAVAGQFGGMDPGVMNTQYMYELRRYEAKSRVPKKSAIIQSNKTETERKDAVENPPVPEETVDLQSVQFVNNRVFPSSQLLKVVKDNLNKPMTPQNLASLRKNIMRFYQMNGYYSAVAIIAAENNKTGEVTIEIQEGPKNSITFE